MRLTSMINFGYNIIKTRSLAKGSFLSLYTSRVFKDTPLDEQPFQTAESAQRFKEYLPLMLLGETGAYSRKNLVTQLDFNPEAEVMRVMSLRGRGLITQQFRIDNIVPVTYADMLVSSPFQGPMMPTFIDGTMVYYNKFNQDFLVFEDDGVWNQETVEHPKLSLEAQFNEREWMDKRTFV